MRYPVIFLIVLSLAACSSRSPFAGKATSVMGDWSPIGSQQVTRQNPFVLAGQYRLYVALAPDGLSSTEYPDLNQTATDTFARYLRRYFLQVETATAAESLDVALSSAARAGASILLLPRVESWPNIDPLRMQECEGERGKKQLRLAPCDAPPEPQPQRRKGELAVSVVLYDVQAQQQIDAIAALGRRGVAAYVYENSLTELELLCEAIARQLSAHGGSR